MNVSRRAKLLSAAVGLTSLLVPSAVSASTTTTVHLGQTSDNAACSFQEPIDAIQTSSSGPRYVVPHGGAITSWSATQALSVPLVMQMEIWRKTSGTYTLVGISPVERLAPNAGRKTFTLSSPMNVIKGDLLGARFDNTNQVSCGLATGSGNDIFQYAYDEVTPDQGDTVSAFPFGFSGLELNMGATLTY